VAQVSIGQVENLEDLIRGLESVREALENACREEIGAAESQCAEAREETQSSEGMLAHAIAVEQAAIQTMEEAQQNVESAENALCTAESAFSACEAQPPDEDGVGSDCSGEAVAVLEAQTAAEAAQTALNEARSTLEKAVEDRQRMEQRVECAKQALAMAEQVLERVQQECTLRLQEVGNTIERGKARLAAAQWALDAYLATSQPAAQFYERFHWQPEHGRPITPDVIRERMNLATSQPAAQFYEWLHWQPEHGRPITPDVIRERMNLSSEQQQLLQEYLYDRNSTYRNMVDKYRGEWAAANGDVERNIVNRNARIHLSGAYAEYLAIHALAPLGGRIETQGRTFVGDDGRYTKTDLIVTDLRVPVVLGRGEGMGAPVGGSLAFEVKCGKADYLYAQKDHMLFQAEGHKQADAHCTLCSRDIHDLPPEKEKELRDALRAAGSPLVGMMPAKNDIDRSCLAFITARQGG
jgi:hypothetical protein